MDSSQSLLTKLTSLSEKALTDRIILPLLSQYNFDYIEHRHGPYEKGVDILCFKTNELDEADLLAIQVKRLQFSGSATEAGHLHGILNQLGQCLEEPIKLRDGTIRLADRVWLISPYPLNISALESAFGKYVQAGMNKIRIIDGHKLLSLILKKAPDLLAELGDKYSLYLKRVEQELTLISEFSAFRLHKAQALLPIYINLDLSIFPQFVLSILEGALAPVGTSKIDLRAQRDRWLLIEQRSKELLGVNIFCPTVESTPRTLDPDVENSVRADSQMLCESIKSICESRLSDLTKQAKTNRGARLVTFHTFTHQLESLCAQAEIRLLFSRSLSFSSHLEYQRINIDPEEMLQSGLNFQVIGQPGAGKTTLMRILGYKQALKRTDRIPIFVSLAAMGSRQSLLSLIERSCTAYDLKQSRTSLEELLNQGRVLLLLDGIDEAVARAKDVQTELLDFMTRFGRTQFIMTSRPWAALLGREQFLTVHLRQFTREQVQHFFANWFVDTPWHAQEIIDFLDENPELYAIISTPLVATTFAVIKSYGGRLPSSLIELYQERLRLLLHDWDAVRGVKRDQFTEADKLFFLRKLAFDLHSNSRRTCHREQMVQLSLKTVGEIRNLTEARSFVEELIQHNNMLFQESDGTWGLGHLQYQEFLTALEAKENPRIQLSQYLRDGWWWSVLKMYAELTRDISGLIHDARKSSPSFHDDQGLLGRLHELLELAPNTESEARVQVEGAFEITSVIDRSYDMYSDDDILAGKGRPHLKTRKMAKDAKSSSFR